jgi:hypothetical protein
MQDGRMFAVIVEYPKLEKKSIKISTRCTDIILEANIPKNHVMIQETGICS